VDLTDYKMLGGFMAAPPSLNVEQVIADYIDEAREHMTEGGVVIDQS
jgi:hypothetical protein